VRLSVKVGNNKDGEPAADMGANEYGGVMGVSNKDGTPVAVIGADEDDNGIIRVGNKYRKVIGTLP
jgi:hypothetical protein